MKRVRNTLISLAMTLLITVMFVPQAFAAEISAEQIVTYQDLVNGVAVMDSGTVYAVAGSSIKGFNSSGTTVYSASLPAKCGNLCAYGEYLFAAGYMSGHMNDIYVLKPGESSSCKTLDAGQRAQAVAVDYDGNLYCVNSTGTGTKTKILRAKISDVVALSSGETIDWNEEFLPDYTPPASSGKCYPQGIAVDGRGIIYIADKGSSNGYDSSVDGIYKYDPKTDIAEAMYFSSGSTHLLFTWIYDICADDYGTVAVVGRNNYEIAVFKPGSTSADAIIKAKGYPEGVGIDKAGNIYFNASKQSDTTKNGIYRINMGHVAVTGVDLPASMSVDVGNSLTLNATVSPSDATNRDVVFSSSDTSVASVDVSGKVTGKKEGKATITVKTVQGRKTASCEVNVSKAEQTVTVSNDSYTKTYGDAAFAIGANTNGDGTLKYTSSDTGVAAVNSEGKVTIKGAGTAKITVYATETDYYKKSAEKTISLTVNKAAQTVTVSNDSYTKTYGDAAFDIGAKTKGNGTLKYTSSDTGVAAVSSEGKITIKGVGTAKITVYATETDNYKKSAEKAVNLTVNKAAQTVTVSNASYTKTYGDAAFDIGAKADGDGTLKYSSNDTGVASVSSKGKVTIKGAGTAKITVYAAGTDNYKKSAEKTVSLTVNKATQAVTVSNTSYTKTYGDAAFDIGAKTSGDGTLKYSSSDTGVAAVSSGGKVTIKGAGTAKITVYATGTDNYKKSAEKTASLTVNKAANPLTVKAKTATVKFSTLKKKAQTLKVTSVMTINNGQGKMNYTIASVKKGSKSFKGKITINKTTGKVTVKKAVEKGTYKVKVKVKAAGNANYKASGVKTVTFTVKVK